MSNPYAKYATSNPYAPAPAGPRVIAGPPKTMGPGEEARLDLSERAADRADRADARAADRAAQADARADAREARADAREARAEQRASGGAGGTPQDRVFLNGLRDQAAAGQQAYGNYGRAAGAIDRSRITPERAAQIKSSVVPPEGGMFDAASASFKRWVNGVSDQEVSDFQYLSGLGSGQVLDRQLEQKGPQTESDAARLSLTEISPYKTRDANAEVIFDGALRSRLSMEKAPFYTRWLNLYGLNGLDPQGRSVDAAWQEAAAGFRREAEDRRGAVKAGRRGQLSRDELAQYRRLVEGGASAARIQAWARSKGVEIANADEIADARQQGGPQTRVSTDAQYQGFSIKRID